MSSDVRIFLKFSGQLQKPRVADPELSSPIPGRRLIPVATKRKSPNHFRFFFATPRARSVPPRAVGCFHQISDWSAARALGASDQSSAMAPVTKAVAGFVPPMNQRHPLVG